MPSSRRELSPLVRELLSEAVDSFEKLEIVLHLHGAHGAETAGDIAVAIGIPGDMSSEALRELAHSGVVTNADATWVLARRGPWREHFGPLVSAVEADRTDVFRFLSSRAMERVRSEAARVFADAFVLRPKKRDGFDD
jgi:hypothetical protein